MPKDDPDYSYVKYTDGSVLSLCCYEGRHTACPQAPDDDTGEPADRAALFGGYYCECCGHDPDTLETVTPLAERAPEVGQLLADLREQERGNDGGWPGGDTVSILCEWFTANGYDIETPLPPEDDDDDDDTCAECGDKVGYVSTRGWCDGCEEEDGS
jgi:hypothetical protein